MAELVAANTDGTAKGQDFYTSTGGDSDITMSNLGVLGDAFSDDFADATTNQLVTAFRFGNAGSDNVVKRYALYAKDYSQYREEWVDVEGADWDTSNSGDDWFEVKLGRLYVKATAPEPLPKYAGMAVYKIIGDFGGVSPTELSSIYDMTDFVDTWDTTKTRVFIQVPFRTCAWSQAGAFRVFPACGTVAG